MEKLTENNFGSKPPEIEDAQVVENVSDSGEEIEGVKVGLDKILEEDDNFDSSDLEGIKEKFEELENSFNSLKEEGDKNLEGDKNYENALKTAQKAIANYKSEIGNDNYNPNSDTVAVCLNVLRRQSKNILEQIEASKKEEGVSGSETEEINETEDNDVEKAEEKLNQTEETEGDSEQSNSEVDSSESTGSKEVSESEGTGEETEETKEKVVDKSSEVFNIEEEPVFDKDLETENNDIDIQNVPKEALDQIDVEDIKNDISLTKDSEEGVVNIDEATLEDNKEAEEVTDTESAPKQEKDKYSLAKKELFLAKKAFNNLKDSYNSDYKKFIDEEKAKRGWKDKLKSFVGIEPKSPELPDDLVSLRKEYNSARKTYIEKFNVALKERGERSGQYTEKGVSKDFENKTYDREKDSVKQAFVKKFVLKPQQELLAIQETKVLSDAQKKTLERILKNLHNNRWAIRTAVVVGHGVLGAATAGGALFLSGSIGSGAAIARIGLGSLVGSEVGLAARSATQGGVDRASNKVRTGSSKLNFEKFNLDDIEDDILSAQLEKDWALKKQKIITYGTAFVAGAGIAGGVGVADDWANSAVDNITAKSSIESPSTGAKELDKHSVNVLRESTSKIGEIDEQIKEAIKNGSENSGGEEKISSAEDISFYNPKEPESYIPSESELSDYLPAEGTPLVKQMSIPNYSFTADSGHVFQTVVNDIKLSGAEDISTEDIEKVQKAVRLASSDILSAHPNTSETEFSRLLQEKIDKQFSDKIDGWNDEVKIEVGGLEKIDKPTATEINSANNEVANSWIGGTEQTSSHLDSYENIPEVIHEVVKGDTLWDIMKEKYSEDLDKLSSQAEKNQALDQLFDSLKGNDELRETINLSKDNPDLIYPGEELNVGPLGEELKKIIELEKNDVDLPIPPKSGILEVATDGSESKLHIVDNSGGVDGGGNNVSESGVTKEGFRNSTIKVNYEGLSSAQNTEIQNFATEEMKRILEQKPSIQHIELSRQLAEAIENKFQSKPWWGSFTGDKELLINDLSKGVQGSVPDSLKFSSAGEVSNLSEIRPYSYDNNFNDPEYQKWAESVMGSQKNIETTINNMVDSIDKQTLDMFSSLDSHDSFYDVYGYLTMAEIEDLQKMQTEYGGRNFMHILNNDAPDIQGIEYISKDTSGAVPEEHNIKYEAVLTWFDVINQIKDTGIHYTPKTTLSDLFSRYAIESQANYSENQMAA